jgi:hypothetical protein
MAAYRHCVIRIGRAKHEPCQSSTEDTAVNKKAPILKNYVPISWVLLLQAC